VLTPLCFPASRPLRRQTCAPKKRQWLSRAVAMLTAAAHCIVDANAGKRFWPRRIRGAQKWNVTSERNGKLKQGKQNENYVWKKICQSSPVATPGP
jgi:hypothetical protein